MSWLVILTGGDDNLARDGARRLLRRDDLLGLRIYISNEMIR